MRRLLLLSLGLAACSHSVPRAAVPSPRTVESPLHRAEIRDAFDAAAQVEDRPPAGAQAKLQVLDMRPLGPSGGDVVLRFDRVVAAADMLPPARLVVESQSRDGTWKSIPGQTTWTRTDRLGFEPADDFPSARRVLSLIHI